MDKEMEDGLREIFVNGVVENMKSRGYTVALRDGGAQLNDYGAVVGPCYKDWDVKDGLIGVVFVTATHNEIVKNAHVEAMCAIISHRCQEADDVYRKGAA
jgi:hypothetical protein